MSSGTLSPQELADLNANKAVPLEIKAPAAPPVSLREQILSFFRGLDGVVLGQHLDIWNQPHSLPGSEDAALVPITPIKGLTGQEFAAWGLVLNQELNTGAYDVPTFRRLLQDSKNDGIPFVHVTWYCQNPMQNDHRDDNPMPAQNFANIMVSGTTENKNFLASVSALITEIKAGTADGSVWILRADIEVNGNWNWVANQDPATYRKFYEFRYNLIIAAGLKDNVIFAGNINGGVGRYRDYFTPVMDMYGLDVYAAADKYHDYINTMYAAVASLETILYLGESGLSLATGAMPAPQSNDMSLWPGLLAPFPKIKMLMCWCQSYAPYNQKNPKGLMNGARMLPLSAIPGVKAG